MLSSSEGALLRVRQIDSSWLVLYRPPKTDILLKAWTHSRMIL